MNTKKALKFYQTPVGNIIGTLTHDHANSMTVLYWWIKDILEHEDMPREKVEELCIKALARLKEANGALDNAYNKLKELHEQA